MRARTTAATIVTVSPGRVDATGSLQPETVGLLLLATDWLRSTGAPAVTIDLRHLSGLDAGVGRLGLEADLLLAAGAPLNIDTPLAS